MHYDSLSLLSDEYLIGVWPIGLRRAVNNTRKTNGSVYLLVLWLIVGAVTVRNRLMKVLSLLKINSGGVVL